MTHPHIVHEADLEWNRGGHGEIFQVDRKQLGAAAGGEKIGCSLLNLPPGKRAWPFHHHFANEEAIYILSGRATLRIGDTMQSIKAGDYIALPARPDLAHQMINDSDEPVQYLCISTMIEPEVVGYPDSGKTGVLAGSAPGGSAKQRLLTAFFPDSAAVDYWQNED